METSQGLSLKKNMIYNSAGTIFYLICQWLITVLVVKLASYEAAGNLSLAIAISNVFYNVAAFGIRSYQVSDIENKYSPSLYVFSRYLTCALSLILCVGFAMLNSHYTIEQKLCVIFYMLFRITEALSDVFQGIQQKAYRMDYIGKSFIMRGIAILVLFCVVIKFTGNLYLAILAMFISVMLIIYIYDWPISCKLVTFQKDYNIKNIKQILIECTPMMFGYMLIASLVSIPRYFLEMYQGSNLLGIYASIATPTVIIQTACNLIYTPLISVLAENYTNKNKAAFFKVLNRVVLTLIVFSVASIIGGMVLGKIGLFILFGQEILPYVYLFVPIILVTIMIAIVFFACILLVICRKLKELVIINSISAVIIGILSPVFIREFNLSGVNYALYVGLGVDIIVTSLTLFKTFKKQFSEKSYN